MFNQISQAYLTKSGQAYARRYSDIRAQSTKLSEHLSAEDQQVQSMPDVSPTKWHLGHTSWFFETFLLQPNVSDYKVFDDSFNFLFNSYYESEGPRQIRAERGLITRPTLENVHAYRAHVDNEILDFLGRISSEELRRLSYLLELGLHHEQQHQELILMDIKHVLSRNPFGPSYRKKEPAAVFETHALQWFGVPGGIYRVGHNNDECFAFDNEAPTHEIVLNDFNLASRCVTNGEYQNFIEDGGYKRPEFWHSDGWALANQSGWEAPLYWRKDGSGDWVEFTFSGLCPIYFDAPVCHISFYEASAYAKWADKRLPTEGEWEVAAQHYTVDQLPDAGSNQLTSGYLRPIPAGKETPKAPHGMLGDVWEWTESSYSPYPGFKVASSSVGEYNGKFMVNQMVLRGASCCTPSGHSRITYRNFYHPNQRWCFSGFRLAD